MNIPSVKRTALHAFFWALAVALCLYTLPAFAQDTLLDQAATEEAWQPPDPTHLPFDWWQQFDTESPQVLRERVDQFVATNLLTIGGLDGLDLVSGQNLLQNVRGQFNLLLIARQPGEPERFQSIPTRDEYSLDELLALRDQWRKLEKRQKIPQLRLDELNSMSSLLVERRDNLLRDYTAADVNSPERILLGLRRIATRVEYELAAQQSRALNRRLEAIQNQQELLGQQFDFAQDHLVAGEVDTAALDQQVADARQNINSLGDKQADVQGQLLGVLAVADAKPSLEIIRKQQLTRAAVELSLARLQLLKLQASAAWHRLRAGTLAFDYDIQAAVNQSQEFVRDTSAQVEVWRTASLTTLLSPAPSADLNSVKNIDLAHSIAQETLGLIDEMGDVIDDLDLLGHVLTVDQVGMQHGLKSVWTRFKITAGDARNALSDYLDITLFHIGDTPVTFGSILKMLLILVLGFALSWLIRHMLEHLKNYRQYAKSPAMYTLGRLLHYIIIFVAVLAAFSSIGLDFRSFALIAGALSVGIGFGLQSIVNNFVSGLILLFEGSLRVGDYIELDTGLRGIVKEINTRATVINTNDSIDVVVPNSNFVTNQLTNWTLREPLARFRIGFGVAYGSDKEKVKAAALEAAANVDFIVHHMPRREPEVWLVNYGDSALEFQLLAWVSKAGVRRPERVRSTVLWELETQLRKHGIEIPFPQRDLHLRSGFPPAEPEKL